MKIEKNIKKGTKMRNLYQWKIPSPWDSSHYTKVQS